MSYRIGSGYELTAEELLRLYLISGDMRELVRNMDGGGSLANRVARLGGLKPHNSLRALFALDDLRRPRPETFMGLAKGCGVPDRATDWMQIWDSVPHPKPAPNGTAR